MGRISRGPRLCLVALLLGSLLGASAVPAEAARAGPTDPAIGPHAVEQARHPVAGALTSAAMGTSVPLARRSLPRGSREVFGFAPYWTLSTQGWWDMGLLSTITYFGLDVNGGGGFDTSTPGWAGWSSAQLSGLVNRAHSQGVRVVLTIKQFDEGTINAIVTNSGVTDTAVGNTINAIAARGLDGVNVDFEGRTDSRYPGIQGGMTHFMAVLSARVHLRWPAAEVSLDTYTGSASWDGGLFKIGDLASHVDTFFVMAYDMAFSDQPGLAGPNAPLTNFTYDDADAVVQYLTRAPEWKVLLGVPYYGYKWSTAGSGLYARATSGATADSYAGILDDMACARMTWSFDQRSQTPWTAWFSPSSGDPCGANRNSWRELYYDDAGSLGLKYDLINWYNLRGAGIWALGYDGSSRDLWNELAVKFS